MFVVKRLKAFLGKITTMVMREKKKNHHSIEFKKDYFTTIILKIHNTQCCVFFILSIKLILSLPNKTHELEIFQFLHEH